MKHNIIVIGIGLTTTTLAKFAANVVVVNEIPKQESFEFKPNPPLELIDTVKIVDIPRNKFFDKPRHNYKK